MRGFTILREDGDDVALTELVWQSADVDVCCVSIVGVPGRGVASTGFELPLVESGDGADGVHGSVQYQMAFLYLLGTLFFFRVVRARRSP